MKTSALVACYNARAHLGECLESLKGFDEVLFLDDGSEDGSADIAAVFEHVTRLPRRGHRGQAQTKRSLIQASTGDAVVLCDADDYLLPGHLGARTRPLARPGVDLTMAPVLNLATLQNNRPFGDLWQMALRLQLPPCGVTWRGEVLRGLVSEPLLEGAVEHQLLARYLEQYLSICDATIPAALEVVRHIGGAPAAAYRAEWCESQAHRSSTATRLTVINHVWELIPDAIRTEAHGFYYEKSRSNLESCAS